jgi:hypothetical protein
MRLTSGLGSVVKLIGISLLIGVGVGLYLGTRLLPL